MKKKVSILMILGFLTCKGFSEEKQKNSDCLLENTSQKQSVMIDIFPAIEGAFEGNTGIGMFYERRINNYISTILEFNFYKNLSNKDINYVIMSHGKVYPFKTTINKAFYSIGFGYRRSLWETDDTSFLLLSLSAGWKFLIGKGFVIEPNIGFWNNIANITGDTSVSHAPILGVNFGWAF